MSCDLCTQSWVSVVYRMVRRVRIIDSIMAKERMTELVEARIMVERLTVLPLVHDVYQLDTTTR